jgi:hypothetical protein
METLEQDKRECGLWKVLFNTPKDASCSETFVMEIPQSGCIMKVGIGVTVALTFVPWSKIDETMEDGKIISRKLINFSKF